MMVIRLPNSSPHVSPKVATQWYVEKLKDDLKIDSIIETRMKNIPDFPKEKAEREKGDIYIRGKC